jgi:hypothetical protein
MELRQQKAFDYAEAAIKQVVTLATVTIGAAIALFDDKSKSGLQLGDGEWIIAGLALTVASAILGMFANNRLAGILVEESAFPNPRIDEPWVYRLWFFQLVTFAGGLASFAIAAMCG